MKIIRPLLQEIYQNDPWKMLCCCIMLNLCRRTTIDTEEYHGKEGKSEYGEYEYNEWMEMQ